MIAWVTAWMIAQTIGFIAVVSFQQAQVVKLRRLTEDIARLRGDLLVRLEMLDRIAQVRLPDPLPQLTVTVDPVLYQGGEVAERILRERARSEVARLFQGDDRPQPCVSVDQDAEHSVTGRKGQSSAVLGVDQLSDDVEVQADSIRGHADELVVDVDSRLHGSPSVGDSTVAPVDVSEPSVGAVPGVGSSAAPGTITGGAA